jgi:hypothetical protein
MRAVLVRIEHRANNAPKSKIGLTENERSVRRLGIPFCATIRSLGTAP